MLKLIRLCCLVSFLQIPAAAQVVPFDSEQWQISGNEHAVEEYLGEQSLRLQGGSATLTEAGFLNGVIEFDIAFPEVRGFTGIAWRMQDGQNYEHFYLRPHQSGNPDANQYTPVFHGNSGWQLYHGPRYGTALDYKFDQWMHVKVRVSGGQAEVYVMDMSQPLLFIDELKREPKAGGAGVTAFGPAVVHFANFSIRKLDDVSLAGKPAEKKASPEGAIMRWLVSDAFPEANLSGRHELEAKETGELQWHELEAEESGIANIGRLQPSTEDKNTAFVRAVIHADAAQTRMLQFGYSDKVRVYLNGLLLYSGDNTYQSRDYRYLGTIGLFDEVPLRLQAGANEVVLAITESFGGWGVLASLPDRSGLRIATR